MSTASANPPTVYVIAGPNGAGKTTFASEFLPDFVDCREFLNADLIAAGLSPFAPESQNIRAGRLLLERIKELGEAKQDFGLVGQRHFWRKPSVFATRSVSEGLYLTRSLAYASGYYFEKTGAVQLETTLSGRSYVRMLKDMQQQGYRVVLFFLWLPSADIAVSRVANRVRQGGHNVPEVDIRRRYVSGQRNLFQLYRPLVNAWWLYDASRLPPSLIASEEDSNLTVVQTNQFENIQRSFEE